MGGTTGSAKVAYGDESIRLSAPTPVYLVAATVLPDDCNLVKLARIKPKAAAKLHWRELTDKLRQEALAEVAAIGGQTTIVAASPLPKKKQERGGRVPRYHGRSRPPLPNLPAGGGFRNES